LAVSPFNTLVGRTRTGVPRIYVNLTNPGAAGGFVPWVLGLGANISFNRPTDVVRNFHDLRSLEYWREEIV